MKERGVMLAILVAALGYFVDIYDLLLFSIVRTPSLRDIGVPQEQVQEIGVHILNSQMFGMLLGGIFWGVLGDKRGRLSVLLGSIVMYSLANIANGWVQTVTQYEILRFVAGVGLAGELGAGITLVAEIMGKNERGYGAMIVAGVGVLGAVLAAFIAERFHWRTAYFIGGGLGLSLLALRVGVLESGMFQNLTRETSRGNFLMLFSDGKRFVRYLACILVGLPTWFVVGILITLSPEMGRAMGIADVVGADGVLVPAVKAGIAIMWAYSGVALGDFFSGWLSQKLRSRRKVIGLFLLLTAILVGVWGNVQGISLAQFYVLCFALGFVVGYWAIFVINSAEQFGTNIRATVTTTTPNFVRGAVPLMTTSYLYLHKTNGLAAPKAALIVGLTCVAIAFGALLVLRETFGKDLDYIEV